MKIPFVKEWGSWAVFISSMFTGIITGLLTHPWQTGRDYSLRTLLTILGLSLLINSKNPLVSILRQKVEKKEHLLWFLFFSLSGLILLIPFLIEGIKAFSIFSLLVLSYVILLLRGKEHYIFAELNGFALLTLSAPIVYFTITGELSLKLYAAVLIFFAAGVFKVRVRLKKTLTYKWIMFFYCADALAIFYYLKIPVILLLPLLENIVYVVILKRDEKLKRTGNTELIKSIVFVILVGVFWQ